MMKYNFAFKDNRLKRWISPSLQNKSQKSYNNYFILFKNYITKNPIIYAPSLIALLVFGSIETMTLIPKSKINSFENDNIKFENLNVQITNLLSKKNKIKSQFNSYESLYKDLAPIYLFSFYLQNTIPEKVSIEEINIDKYAYKIIASSIDLNFINNMVTLLVESPLIDLDTIRINNIFNEKTSTLQNKKIKESIFKAEIKGTLKALTLKNKMELYKESSAKGLLRKLSKYEKLRSLIN